MLGLFIQLLELVSEDKELKNYLAKEASNVSSISTKNAAITTEDLPQVFFNFLVNNLRNILFLINLHYIVYNIDL